MNGPPLFVIPSVATGGAELQLMLQLSALRQRGLAPRLMVLSERVDPDVLALAGLPSEHVITLGLPSDVLDKAFLRHCFGPLGQAARFVASHSCDRIVALLPAAHFFARLLKLMLLVRRCPVRLIQYHHSEENTLNPRDTTAKKLFFRVNQLLARSCDHAHWHVSEQVLADVCAASATRRDVVLYNTCNMETPGDADAATALLPVALREGGTYSVLLPGRLQAVKGHALLIEAARRLVEQDDPGARGLHLIFAGEGPERAAIEAAIDDAGMQDRVTLLGNVPHGVLLGLYGMVDAVAVPSLSEGFGIVAIEALSRGALLIASDAAGLRAIVRPGVNGLSFPAGDIDALYRLLRDARARRGEPIIDRQAARADTLRRFGLEAHIDRMLALL